MTKGTSIEPLFPSKHRHYLSSFLSLILSSDVITDTYTPPFPSVTNLPQDNRRYSYLSFPPINPALIGPLRPCKVLVASEVTRATGGGVLLSGLTTGSTGTLRSKKIDIRILFFDAKNMYRKVQLSITSFKALFRMKRVRRRYLLLLSAVIKIQKRFRFNRKRKSRLIRFYAVTLVKLQAYVRMHRCLSAYRFIKRKTIQIQSHFRRMKFQRIFYKLRDLVIFIQTFFRRALCRIRLQAFRKAKLIEYRRLIFALWKTVHTPLIYRAYFWSRLSAMNYTSLGLHRAEILRLLVLMGVRGLSSTCNTPAFQNAYREVKANRMPSNVASLPIVMEFEKKEKEERVAIYNAMKAMQAKSKSILDPFFLPFQLISPKKRKQTVRDLLFFNYEQAEASVSIIVNLLKATFTYEDSGVEEMQNRVRKELLGLTSLACFRALRRRSAKKEEKKIERRQSRTSY